MQVSIPGFPVEVSEAIELPDIAELLMYPAFNGIAAEQFLKSASEFQRYLFDRIPLKNDKKTVIVRSGVWLLEPGTRSSIVNRKGEWHIDGNSNFDHVEPEHRIHILSSPCSALTEFNVNPLHVESPPDETRIAFANRIGNSPEEFGISAAPIEPCRFYTFTNHLHRAVDPKRIEFRFFFRVRESDVPPDSYNSGPVTRVFSRDADSGDLSVNVEYGTDKVSIFYPRAFRGGEMGPRQSR